MRPRGSLRPEFKISSYVQRCSCKFRETKSPEGQMDNYVFKQWNAIPCMINLQSIKVNEESQAQMDKCMIPFI